MSLRAVVPLLCLASCAPQYALDGRAYAVSGPADVTGPLPLVILLHGYGVTADVQDVVLPFSRDIASRRFFYVLPNGTVNAKGRRFWNASQACCNFDHLDVDDVGFLRALIAEVKANHPIDPKRVFLLGHSNGGFMALRMACDASADVTGVMALAGAAPPECHRGRPVATLLVHGTKDETIKYGGGTTEGGAFGSAHATLATMAARNGCGATTAAVGSSDFIGDGRAETSREAAQGCPAGGRAELWSADGEGHAPFFSDAFRAAVLDFLMAETR